MKQKITSTLDRIASSLQDAGLTHLAEQVDSVTNVFDIPESETEPYKEKYGVLQDWIRQMYNSSLSGNSLQKLNLLVGRKILVKDELLGSHEWKAFEAAIAKIKEKTGEIIPERFFYHPTGVTYKWDELLSIPKILDIKFSASTPGGIKTLDAERQHRQQQAPQHSNAWEKADSLFKHATVILDPGMIRLDKLIRSLKRNT